MGEPIYLDIDLSRSKPIVRQTCRRDSQICVNLAGFKAENVQINAEKSGKVTINVDDLASLLHAFELYMIEVDMLCTQEKERTNLYMKPCFFDSLSSRLTGCSGAMGLIMADAS